MILTVDQIISAPDVKTEELLIPEWGGSITVKGLTRAEVGDAREAAKIADEVDDQRLEMFIFLAGVQEPKFTPDHYELLRNKLSGPVTRVGKKILELSGLDEKTVKDAENTFRKGLRGEIRILPDEGVGVGLGATDEEKPQL